MVVLGVLLSGCITPEVVTSTPRQITIKDVSYDTINQAQDMAEKWCNKQGNRHAVIRPDERPDGYVFYECVE